MELRGEHAIRLASKAGNSFIQNIDMCDLERGILHAVCVNDVAVVLGNVLDGACGEIFNGVIAAVVTEFQLFDLCTVCKTHELVTKTHTENGVLTLQSIDEVCHFCYILGSAGTTGNEDAVGLHHGNVFCGCCVRKNGYVAAHFIERTNEAESETEVDCNHVVFCISCARIPTLAVRVFASYDTSAPNAVAVMRSGT